MSQLNILANNNIQQIYIETNVNSCGICKNNFNKKIDIFNIDEIMIHPYCYTEFKL